jgi:uncharacterized protein YndB with AHSA1/START domain
MSNDDFARVIDPYTFGYTRTYPHPIDRVWRAITDPAEISEWFWTAKFDLRPGAAFSFGPEDGGIRGVIVALEPPRLIRFSDPPAGGEGYFEFALSTVEGGTRLDFVQHGTPAAVPEDWPWPGLLAGWHANLDHLGVLLRGGVWLGDRATEAALAERYRERLRATQPSKEIRS